jgi:hypothetical protein
MTFPNIEPDQTEAQLIEIYDYFLASTGLPSVSADELLFHAVTPEQRDWIERFIEAWETMRDDERDWMQYAKQKAGLK